MNRNTVAVIIPVYNCERFIGDALKSIEEQTEKPDRVVVVDDGSTDRTRQTVSEFARHSSLAVELLSQQNKGAATARNTAAARCTEDFIVFLDADDTFYPSFFEKASKVLDNHPDLLLCFLDRDVVDENGEFLRLDLDHPKFRAMPVETRADGTSVLADNLFLTLTTGSVIPMGMMVRRVAYDRVSGFDETLRAIEDRLFFMKLSKFGKFGFIDEPLGTWRRHASNASGDNNAFNMQLNTDLALAKMESEADQWQLDATELRAVQAERKRTASRLLYAASNEGHKAFVPIVWRLIHERRAPWHRIPKTCLRYAWRCLQGRRPFQ